MDFSVVIPAKNEQVNIQRCLQSILAVNYPSERFEIIVVDNGSSDRTVEVAKRYQAKVYQQPQLTISGLRNFGAAQAQGKILVFLDADCSVPQNWLINAEKYLNKKNISCFGSAPSVPDNATWVQKSWYQVRKKQQIVELVEWLESMNMFIPAVIFNKVGGFNEALITCEDYELCQRLISFGHLISDQRISAVHHGEAADVRHFFRKERWRATSNYQGLIFRKVPLKEWPSILLPLIQVASSLIAVFLFLASCFGWTGWLWFLGFLLVWQLPILILAIRKTVKRKINLQTIKFYSLFNVYFFARGCAFFSVKRR